MKDLVTESQILFDETLLIQQRREVGLLLESRLHLSVQVGILLVLGQRAVAILELLSEEFQHGFAHLLILAGDPCKSIKALSGADQRMTKVNGPNALNRVEVAHELAVAAVGGDIIDHAGGEWGFEHLHTVRVHVVLNVACEVRSGERGLDLLKTGRNRYIREIEKLTCGKEFAE